MTSNTTSNSISQVLTLAQITAMTPQQVAALTAQQIGALTIN